MDIRRHAGNPRERFRSARDSRIAVAVLAAVLWFAQVVPADAEHRVTGAWLGHSAAAGRDLGGFPADEEKTARELSRLADRLRPALAAEKGGAGVVGAFRRVLLKEEGFRYDAAPGDVRNFLAGEVVGRKRGNCLGLSLLWLSLAEQLGVPFRGVYVPGHCFVRYEGGGFRVNVEFSDRGAPRKDEFYLQRFRLTERGPYLRSLTGPEMTGVFLKSLGAAYAGKGMHAKALDLYAEAERLYPGLPDVHYNAGVSLQRLGRADEAIAKYRLAVSLDPNLVVARGNLASTLAACGDYDEGIREYRKALDLDPANAKAREGLAKVWFAKGDYPEAAREVERAEALGCTFDPTMLEALEPYRDRNPPASPR